VANANAAAGLRYLQQSHLEPCIILVITNLLVDRERRADMYDGTVMYSSKSQSTHSLSVGAIFLSIGLLWNNILDAILSPVKLFIISMVSEMIIGLKTWYCSNEASIRRSIIIRRNTDLNPIKKPGKHVENDMAQRAIKTNQAENHNSFVSPIAGINTIPDSVPGACVGAERASGNSENAVGLAANSAAASPGSGLIQGAERGSGPIDFTTSLA